jgi:hypothetical protein
MNIFVDMDQRRLYFFNPDHDLALANGSENFHAPLAARLFAADAASLPMWYAVGHDAVFWADYNSQWGDNIVGMFPQLANIEVVSDLSCADFDCFSPWGWNQVVAKQLRQGGKSSLVPSDQLLEDIRKFSHRISASTLLNWLLVNVPMLHGLPEPAAELKLADVETFASLFPRVVFKAPWSGSGRGLFWVNGAMSRNALNWCAKIIEKQGSILGEQAYDKVIDFALEFNCNEGVVSFSGYSLFETDRKGTYRANILAPDDIIFQHITRYITPEVLLSVRQGLLTYFQQNVSTFYNGYFGVDMLVFRQGNSFLLHPCVEINFRMTMGMVARSFFNNYVDDSVLGRFYVDYCAEPGSLYSDHIQREKSLPLHVVDGKIAEGYIPLTPVTPYSHYRVRAEIGRND